MSEARVEDRAVAGGVGKRSREAPPQTDGAEALVQQQQGRQLGVAGQLGGLETPSVDEDATADYARTRRCASTSASRSLNRWIFPVAVRGKSSTNSIKWGYS